MSNKKRNYDAKTKYLSNSNFNTKTIYSTIEGTMAAIDSGEIVYADTETRIFEKHYDVYFIRDTTDNSLVPMIDNSNNLAFTRAFSNNVLRDLIRAIRKAATSYELNGKIISGGDKLISEYLTQVANTLEG